jgi:hypothetical protein
MNIIKIISKITNILFLGLSLIYLIFLSAITESFVFLALCVVLLITLIRYIRNKDWGWHNIVLTFFWVFIGFGILVCIVLYEPLELIFADSHSLGPYANFIELLLRFSSDIDNNNGVFPDYVYDIILEMIVYYIIVTIMSFFLISFNSIYCFILLLGRKIKKYKLLIWITIIFSHLGLMSYGIYKVLFGEMTTGMLSIYFERDNSSWNVDLNLKEKINSYGLLRDDICNIISFLDINFVGIIITVPIIILFIVSVSNKQINTKYNPLKL